MSDGTPLSTQDGDWIYSEESVHPDDPIRLRGLIAETHERARQPVDLNYIAILKDDWERIKAMVGLARSDPCNHAFIVPVDALVEARLASRS